LTLKSNGCLIMIAALSPTEIVVASKHSLGTTIEQSVDGVTAELNSVKLDKKDDKEEQKEKAEDASEEKESRAHAEVGREWVARTLKKSGKTSEQLAKRLWDDNVTAVLEVSDETIPREADRSFATTRSRSTLLPRPSTGPVSTSTASTTTGRTLRPRRRKRWPSLPRNLVSS